MNNAISILDTADSILHYMQDALINTAASLLPTRLQP
jgi:hypothetical protein